MKRCPITLEIISDSETYSAAGLHLLSPQLKKLEPLQFSALEQRQEAIRRVGKMSIQGIQAKLSAKLKVKEGQFEIVDQGGRYILKPQSDHYLELAENEALSMSMAQIIGLAVPVHGLVYSKDGSFTYFIKRFDREGHNHKLAVEDFAQLAGGNRDTKYESSMEKVGNIIEQFCTFPKIEFVKLLKLTLFNFLIGNEDMHLKNFSLITKRKVMLSPAYDLLNSTIALGHANEEIALSLNGKKSNLKQRDFIDYFAKQRLHLNTVVIEQILAEIQSAIPQWKQLITESFLSAAMQDAYLSLLKERSRRLGLKFD